MITYQPTPTYIRFLTPPFPPLSQLQLTAVQGDDELGLVWKYLSSTSSSGSVSSSSLAAASDDEDEVGVGVGGQQGREGGQEVICRICRDGVLLDVEPTETQTTKGGNVR